MERKTKEFFIEDGCPLHDQPKNERRKIGMNTIYKKVLALVIFAVVIVMGVLSATVLMGWSQETAVRGIIGLEAGLLAVAGFFGGLTLLNNA